MKINFSFFNYKKNVDQRYPLHCVIESQCVDNLKEVSNLFSYYDAHEKLQSNGTTAAHNIETLKYSPYVNVKDQNSKNSLHILAESLTADSFDVIFPMMKILLAHGCNANFPDHDGKTSFFIVLEKFQFIKEAKTRKEILDYFLSNAKIDFYSHRSDELIEMVMNQKLKFQVPEKEDFQANYENMMQLLVNGDINSFETRFSLFKSFCEDSETYAECCASFLEVAVMRSLINIVDLLIDFGVNINRIPKGMKIIQVFFFIILSPHI